VVTPKSRSIGALFVDPDENEPDKVICDWPMAEKCDKTNIAKPKSAFTALAKHLSAKLLFEKPENNLELPEENGIKK
jgi:hypothetical protein